jgi:hypothetical protein
VQEVAKRYRISNPGRENRSIENIFRIIEIYERRDTSHDTTLVKVNYSINGKKEEIWNFCGN